MDKPQREARAKVRTYVKDGEEKSIYATIGYADVSSHGNKVVVYLDSIPLNFDGRIYINAPYEKDKNEQTHDFNKKMTEDVIVEDIDDKPIDLSEIPF